MDLLPIEKLLGVEFTSDPRLSRYPLPGAPDGWDTSRPYIHSDFVLTPEVARDWLTHRVIRLDRMPSELKHDEVCTNRKFLLHHARKWGKRILGELPNEDPYNPGNHQGFAVTWDGFLLDGQHRAAGVLLSKTAIPVPLAEGTPWSAFKVMDSNLHRTPSQMIDVPHPQVVSSIARHLLPVLHGVEEKEMALRGHTQDIIDIAEGWHFFQRGAMNDGSDWVKDIKAASKSGIPSALLGASVIGALAGGADPFEVHEFVRGVNRSYRDGYPSIHGDGSDPRHLLRLEFDDRRMLKDGKGRYVERDQRANAALIRKAMTAWLERDDPKMKVKNTLRTRTLHRVIAGGPLPPFWGAEGVREYHRKNVN